MKESRYWLKQKIAIRMILTFCFPRSLRPQEKKLEKVRSTGAAFAQFLDGDVAGVMHCAESEITGIDMYMGVGGAPQGGLAAAALKSMGGQIPETNI
ncbi:MAG: hypothetical protein CM15mP54_20050 [Paracoccaceae bacterium]|nr:MAG: hypothetical protein CM15mP54_20050 [Paracoccaceae bacterium]